MKPLLMCIFPSWSIKAVASRNTRTPKWEEERRLSHSPCLLEVAKQQPKPWNPVLSSGNVEYGNKFSNRYMGLRGSY